MTTRTLEQVYNGVACVSALIVLYVMIRLAQIGDVGAACIALLVLCLILWRWLDVTADRRHRRRGSMVITTASATGIAVGDVVYDGRGEGRRVLAVDGNRLTVATRQPVRVARVQQVHE